MHTDTLPAAIAEADAWKWRAFLARTLEADGLFVVAVRTTGIYCRPSCPARKPKPENVTFFTLNREAEAAGFRPCKRCRPDAPSRSQTETALVETACRTIEAAERAPSLAELAADAGLSQAHFHRLFRRIAGTTPKAYAKALRERREGAALEAAFEAGQSVTAAIHEAGYECTARFYEGATERLGMAPKARLGGGSGETVHVAVVPCWLGLALIGATARGVCLLRFGEDEATLRAGLAKALPKARIETGGADFEALLAAVLARIERPESTEELPLDIQGSLFEQQVWTALRTIPAGETRSYSQLAAQIGRPDAVRAVASACGRNPVAVLNPCHRVVAKSGKLAGYAWGIERKAALLARERKK
ncbi:MAG: bifunctional DNA-binding transcriptional regulator/O6-methylguanine-DNA methyltransferase Ada [Pseudomonadota bacterium]